MTTRRVTIQWTETAKRCLAKLPLKVRKGLLDKADSLLKCDDPRKVYKPLLGPLQGYYRIAYGRYRAIYSVDEEILDTGDILIHIKIRFVAAGIRKEGDKKDVYNLALRLLALIDREEDSTEKDD